MNILQDGALVASVIGIINTVANIYWSLKLKSVQGNTEINRALREENAELKEVLSNSIKKKNQYKLQYNTLFHHMKKLEGKHEAYEEIKEVVAAKPQNTIASQ